MSITERWIIGLLLAMLSAWFGEAMHGVREDYRNLRNVVGENTAKTSSLVTKTDDLQQQINRRDEDRRRELDQIQTDLRKHRDATEKR